jgi:glyoxylase-like metal-dependent hydrolase (beta-lactamase superfamily II)
MDIDLIEGGPFDSNIYLISRKETRVLVDAGSGFNNKKVEELLESKLKGSSLDAIILTHEHFDHSGGALYLSMKFNAPLYSSPECARALREADQNLTGSFLFGAHMEPIMEIMEMEDQVKIGDIGFEVHSTPGHAPGLICLIEKEERALFCGDLLFCDGGVGRWDLPGGNLELLRDSVRRSMNWNVSSLYPGHGRFEERDPRNEMNLAMGMLSSV